MTVSSIINKAEAWLNSNIDEKSKQEIKDLLNASDKTDLIDSFYKDLEFGTGGLRGLMGVGSNRIMYIPSEWPHKVWQII